MCAVLVSSGAEQAVQIWSEVSGVRGLLQETPRGPASLAVTHCWDSQLLHSGRVVLCTERRFSCQPKSFFFFFSFFFQGTRLFHDRTLTGPMVHSEGAGTQLSLERHVCAVAPKEPSPLPAGHLWSSPFISRRPGLKRSELGDCGSSFLRGALESRRAVAASWREVRGRAPAQRLARAGVWSSLLLLCTETKRAFLPAALVLRGTDWLLPLVLLSPPPRGLGTAS